MHANKQSGSGPNPWARRSAEYAGGLHHHRGGLGRLRAGQPADRGSPNESIADRGRRARLEPADPHPRRVLQDARPRYPDVEVSVGARPPPLAGEYRAEPDPGTNGRAIVYTRGRVIGGSSSINGLIYIRGQPEDYDHWAQLGNRGWSWDDCLPYFRQAERWEGDGSEVRGKEGPLFTSKTDRPAICATVIEAGKEIGLEYRDDLNDLPPGHSDCIGWCQQTRGGPRRASPPPH